MRRMRGEGRGSTSVRKRSGIFAGKSELNHERRPIRVYVAHAFNNLTLKETLPFKQALPSLEASNYQKQLRAVVVLIERC